MHSPCPSWHIAPCVRRVLTPMSPGNALIAVDWAVMLCGRRIADLVPTERMATAWLTSRPSSSTCTR